MQNKVAIQDLETLPRSACRLYVLFVSLASALIGHRGCKFPIYCLCSRLVLLTRFSVRCISSSLYFSLPALLLSPFCKQRTSNLMANVNQQDLCSPLTKLLDHVNMELKSNVSISNTLLSGHQHLAILACNSSESSGETSGGCSHFQSIAV